VVRRYGWFTRSAQFHDPSVQEFTYKVLAVFREQSLRFFVGNGWVNDDIFTLLPVDWCGNSVLVSDLKGWRKINLVQLTSSHMVMIYAYSQRHCRKRNQRPIFSYVYMEFLPKDFVKVASSRCGVSKSETDSLLGVNHKDRADL